MRKINSNFLNIEPEQLKNMSITPKATINGTEYTFEVVSVENNSNVTLKPLNENPGHTSDTPENHVAFQTPEPEKIEEDLKEIQSKIPYHNDSLNIISFQPSGGVFRDVRFENINII